MNTHYEYTPFARELFWEMENFGYITFTKKDAYKTIKNYLSKDNNFKSKNLIGLIKNKKKYIFSQ